MKHYIILVLAINLIIPNVQSKLLDKTAAVVNGTVITLSQVKRIKSNLLSRRNISPLIYKKDNYTLKELLDLSIRRLVIREKLSEIGYVRNDDQVENEIINIEKRLGLNRAQLLNFLDSNGITFDEYFELMRETIEFNIFNARIIKPLISVTEQEIKNEFYKSNQDKTLAFKYNLVDFSLNKKFFTGNMLSNFTAIMTKFQVNGILPSTFSDIETNLLGDITEDGLTKNLRTALKKTDEGKFSKPVLLSDTYHVFFVKKKDLVESDIYVRQKDRIRMKLLEKNALQVTSLWFQREVNKHYIKKFL